MALENILRTKTYDDWKTTAPEGTPAYTAHAHCPCGQPANVFPAPGVTLCGHCGVSKEFWRQVKEEAEQVAAKAAELALEKPAAPAGLGTAQGAMAYLLAGRAYLTLVSEVTGARFTFRVSKSKMNGGKDDRLFVSVLTGSDNTLDYTFLGTIFDRNRYHHGSKSKIGKDAPSARAFEWAFKHLAAGRLPPTCTLHHEGHCGKCGRLLTDPESVAAGLGPTCRGSK